MNPNEKITIVKVISEKEFPKVLIPPLRGVRGGGVLMV